MRKSEGKGKGKGSGSGSGSSSCEEQSNFDDLPNFVTIVFKGNNNFLSSKTLEVPIERNNTEVPFQLHSSHQRDN